MLETIFPTTAYDKSIKSVRLAAIALYSKANLFNYIGGFIGQGSALAVGDIGAALTVEPLRLTISEIQQIIDKADVRSELWEHFAEQIKEVVSETKKAWQGEAAEAACESLTKTLQTALGHSKLYDEAKRHIVVAKTQSEKLLAATADKAQEIANRPLPLDVLNLLSLGQDVSKLAKKFDLRVPLKAFLERSFTKEIIALYLASLPLIVKMLNDFKNLMEYTLQELNRIWALAASKIAQLRASRTKDKPVEEKPKKDPPVPPVTPPAPPKPAPPAPPKPAPPAPPKWTPTSPGPGGPAPQGPAPAPNGPGGGNNGGININIVNDNTNENNNNVNVGSGPGSVSGSRSDGLSNFVDTELKKQGESAAPTDPSSWLKNLIGGGQNTPGGSGWQNPLPQQYGGGAPGFWGGNQPQGPYPTSPGPQMFGEFQGGQGGSFGAGTEGYGYGGLTDGNQMEQPQPDQPQPVQDHTDSNRPSWGLKVEGELNIDGKGVHVSGGLEVGDIDSGTDQDSSSGEHGSQESSDDNAELTDSKESDNAQDGENSDSDDSKDTTNQDTDDENLAENEKDSSADDTSDDDTATNTSAAQVDDETSGQSLNSQSDTSTAQPVSDDAGVTNEASSRDEELESSTPQTGTSSNTVSSSGLANSGGW